MFFSAIALNAFGILFFWFANNWQSTSAELRLVSVGDLLGLFLALSVLHQFLLQSRLPVMERYVGLLLQHKLHRLNGYLIFYLLIAHVFFVTYGHQHLHELSFIDQTVSQFKYYPWVWLAYLAAAILIGIIAMSITMVRKRLRYEYWYLLHLSVYVAVLTAFLHQINNGLDLLSNDWFKAYWFALYILILGTIGWFRFGRLVLRYFVYDFTVSKVVKEANGVISIYISSKKPLPANFYIPGQFGIWRFFDKKLWWQTHPFTISMGDPINGLRLTPKAVGDYTTDLQEIKPGTKLFFDGPHGVFTGERLEGAKPLLIAGGIGITPIRAILEGLGNAAKDAVVLYSVRTAGDLALAGELDAISKKTGAKLHYIFSEKAPAGGIKGILDKPTLAKLVKDASKRKVALCGPPAMMDAVEQSLMELGVAKKNIFTERFAFTAR